MFDDDHLQNRPQPIETAPVVFGQRWPAEFPSKWWEDQPFVLLWANRGPARPSWCFGYWFDGWYDDDHNRIEPTFWAPAPAAAEELPAPRTYSIERLQLPHGVAVGPLLVFTPDQQWVEGIWDGEMWRRWCSGDAAEPIEPAPTLWCPLPPETD